MLPKHTQQLDPEEAYGMSEQDYANMRKTAADIAACCFDESTCDYKEMYPNDTMAKFYDC